MQPVRLLLIGAGVIGRTHIDRIGRDPHLALAGIAEPSQADELITIRIRDALALVDIRVLDHLVVGGNVVVSFAERGLL